MFCGTILGMFAEKMTTYPMYTKLAIDYEDKGTVTSKRLGKPIPLYQALASLLQKEYLFPSLYPSTQNRNLKKACWYDKGLVLVILYWRIFVWLKKLVKMEITISAIF